MIKNALSKNKFAFIFLLVGLGCFLLDYLTVFIYSTSNGFLASKASHEILLGLACALLLGELMFTKNNQEYGFIVRIILFASIMFFSFFNLIGQITTVTKMGPYYSGLYKGAQIVNLFTTLFFFSAFVLLFISLFKEIKVLQIIALALAGTCILFVFIANILNMIYTFEIVYVFDMLFSMSLYACFFIGYFLYVNKDFKFPLMKKEETPVAQTEVDSSNTTKEE